MGLLNTELFRSAMASDRVVAILKRTVPPLDRALLRASRGWINTGMQSVALLQTIGARSGLAREIATLVMPADTSLVLVGSNWGQEQDPAWVHNIRHNGQVRVTFRGYVGPMQPTELTGIPREAMWQRLVQFNPQYARYQSAVTRLLPVIELRLPGA